MHRLKYVFIKSLLFLLQVELLFVSTLFFIAITSSEQQASAISDVCDFLIL